MTFEIPEVSHNSEVSCKDLDFESYQSYNNFLLVLESYVQLR